MKSGRYFVCDPCYLFHGKSESGSALGWLPFLSLNNYFSAEEVAAKDGIFTITWEGVEYEFGVANTAYGDGCFDSNFPGEPKFDVDAGMLAVVPVEMFEKVIGAGVSASDYAKSESLLIVELSEFTFDPGIGHGEIGVGDYVIETGYGDTEYDEDDEYEEGSSYEDIHGYE